MKTVNLLSQHLSRMAFPASRGWLRAVIAPNQIGVYMLLRHGKPFYVGRSDQCVLARLLNHEKLAHANHFIWHRCRTRETAYHTEAFWYDQLAPSGLLVNKMHPAKPDGHLDDCPFCAIQPEHVAHILPNWDEKIPGKEEPEILVPSA
ncbi:hypothetical protein [Roseivivax marinus]|uniref:hypothetical protein n=1 Tax=Roseivivax marinus TaxID=1379903 RepID=UPI00103DA709|nr:hypothetical protein [Roseivivax marinus]